MSTKEVEEEKEEAEVEQHIPVLDVDESLSVEERFTDNAIDNILPARYLVKDEDGKVVEEPHELFERVADNIATAEYQFAQEQGVSDEEAHRRFEECRDELEELMKTQRFIFNSPTLMNAGARLGNLSACFVNSPKDDLEDIAQTEKEWTLVQKTGGGMGGDFSALRPKGTLIDSTKGVSSGPVSFMTKFNEVAGVIKQGGVRRSAQMAELRVDHPDIGRFAVAKREEGKLDNFNISVSVIDEFIEAVEKDEMYTLYSPQSDFEEPFEIVEATEEFYSPEYEDAPKGVGRGLVSENVWRDHADSIQAWDWDEKETVSFREKWYDRFEAASEDGRFGVGEEMKLPARFIWDIVLDGAWQNGEPGCFHLDEVNRQHSFDGERHPDYEVFASNPCCAEGTLVNTPEGYSLVENVSEGDVISTVYDEEEVDEVLSFNNKDVYRVEFSDGGVQRVTEDHRYHAIKDGSKRKRIEDRPLRDLEEGDYVRLHQTKVQTEGNNQDYERGLKQGILIGDGCYTECAINRQNIVQIASSSSKEEYNKNIKELFEEKNFNADYNPEKNDYITLKHSSGKELIEELGLSPEKTLNKSFSAERIKSERHAIGLIDGLVATDGNVHHRANYPRVRIATSSEDLARDIRNIFLSVGCHGRISSHDRTGGNTEYEVYISGESLRRYTRLTNLSDLHPEKGEKVDIIRKEFLCTGNTWKTQIESIEKCSETETVYDLYCSDSDTWITEGYVNRGCSEQPLVNHEACNLGHINLSLMVDKNAPAYDEYVESVDYNYYTTQAEAYDYFEEAVDFEELDRVIESGVRALDNVVTMSEFPLEEIEERVSSMRKIGLGVMGWAQMCYQMGVRYGSDESLQLGRVVMNYIDEKATEYSHELAKERGSFDAWGKSKYANPQEYPEWFRTHAYRLAENWEDGYEMRNHNVTTVAPTGTTSMLCDTSGGIEPVYNVAYKKNVGGDIQGDIMLVEFDDVFIETLEANEKSLDHSVEEIKEIAAEQMDNNEFEGVSGLPVPEWMKETFVTTNDVAPEEHVLMQRVFQEGVDSGLSKTINLPSDATHADVHDAYMLAMDDNALGSVSKGLTVYRDQSREEQVLTTKKYSDLEVSNAKEMLEDLGYKVSKGGDDE